MAEFNEAFENTLRFEDAGRVGVVTRDAGGRTRFGIAEKFHRELPEDFFTGPADEALGEAEEIEEREYWSAMRLGEIESQAVANKLFDMAVNMGVRQATVLAQRAVNAVKSAQPGAAPSQQANSGPAGSPGPSTPSRATPARAGDPVPSTPSRATPARAGDPVAVLHDLSEDGLVGNKTLAAINSVDAGRYLQMLREMSAEFYRHVASLHPAEAVDLQGWLRRASA